MCKVICVTQSSLAENFPRQLERICEGGISRVILREKQLNEEEYESLATTALECCKRHSVPLSLHSFYSTAQRLGCSDIHLTFKDFSEGKGDSFETVGVSVHSAEEARAVGDRAKYMSGRVYLIAGHIFPTDCKKGLPPRGTDFLHSVCAAVPLDVYAIGGITPQNAEECVKAGAAGVCLMSSLMTSPDPERIISQILEW